MGMKHDRSVLLRPWIPLTFALALASFGCLTMILLRVVVTGSIRYTFLLWNLFLAWIPYVLALAVRRIVAGPEAAEGAGVVAAGVKPLDDERFQMPEGRIVVIIKGHLRPPKTTVSV